MKEKLMIIIVILAFFLATSLAGFLISIFPFKITSTMQPSDLGLEHEDVRFTTVDGIELAGWFIPHPDGNAVRTIILLHGYPADKGNILPFLSFLRERYNLFLFDFRGLGQSGGHISTAGAREVEDLKAAVAYLKGRGIEEVGVWGFSMGGAVALMTAPSAPEIRAVVAESPYARLDLMAQELYRIPLLKYPLANLTRIWAVVFLGLSVRKVAPVEAVKELQIPILLIHSKADNVIPFDPHATQMKESLSENPQAEFWFPEMLIHGQLDEEHQRRISEFFQRNF